MAAMERATTELVLTPERRAEIARMGPLRFAPRRRSPSLVSYQLVVYLILWLSRRLPINVRVGEYGGWRRRTSVQSHPR